MQFNVETLRNRTAEYIRSHRDDFWPFLVKEDTGDLYSPGKRSSMFPPRMSQAQNVGRSLLDRFEFCSDCESVVILIGC